MIFNGFFSQVGLELMNLKNTNIHCIIFLHKMAFSANFFGTFFISIGEFFMLSNAIFYPYRCIIFFLKLKCFVELLLFAFTGQNKAYCSSFLSQPVKIPTLFFLQLINNFAALKHDYVTLKLMTILFLSLKLCFKC